MMGDFDVRDILSDIKVPVMVQHRSGDRVIPVERGRQLAASIEGAVLHEYEGIDHFGYLGDLGWIDDIEQFVTGSVQRRPVRPQSSDVTISTLGRFSVEIDGQDMPSSVWGGRMARQLCKRLVAARGWPVTREHLFDMLWPNETDLGKLGARLSVQLSAVRRVLKGGVIADRQTVALNLNEVSTDLERLLEAPTDEEAVMTYTGEFLPDDVEDEWAVGLRETARSKFTTAARRLAAGASAEGRHGEAVELARRLIDADRYDETAHSLLVDSLAALDDTSGARRAHDRWSRWLAELGIEVPPFSG
jgi:DNA-binding SARP family transcriptional activator